MTFKLYCIKPEIRGVCSSYCKELHSDIPLPKSLTDVSPMSSSCSIPVSQLSWLCRRPLLFFPVFSCSLSSVSQVGVGIFLHWRSFAALTMTWRRSLCAASLSSSTHGPLALLPPANCASLRHITTTGLGRWRKLRASWPCRRLRCWTRYCARVKERWPRGACGKTGHCELRNNAKSQTRDTWVPVCIDPGRRSLTKRMESAALTRHA